MGIRDFCILKSLEKVTMNIIWAIRNSPRPTMKYFPASSSKATSPAAQSRRDTNSNLPVVLLTVIRASTARLIAGIALITKLPA